jgi:hypothetical protein
MSDKRYSVKYEIAFSWEKVGFCACPGPCVCDAVKDIDFGGLLARVGLRLQRFACGASAAFPEHGAATSRSDIIRAASSLARKGVNNTLILLLS